MKNKVVQTMKNPMVQSAAKAVVGIVLTVGGTVLGAIGVRDLCFEKHEVGDLVQEVKEETEEVF